MMANMFELPTYGISVIESFKTGIPGIIIQLICLPIIARIINERLKQNND